MAMFTFFQGCSPGYVMRAAYEQSKILYAREDISDVIDSPDAEPELKSKLQTVLDAREFAMSIGLDPGKSFTKYAKVDHEPLSWVVMGARRDSFTLAGWWFPIVGTVPYKGFFDKEDADELEKDLQKDGYETSVRPTDAFSTLGWFNDPILSTTLKFPVYRIANTVIHESVHSTVWVKGHVPFNESLANFVGTEGAITFFEKQLQTCLAEKCEPIAKSLEAARASREMALNLSAIINTLFTELDALYTSNRSPEEKIRERDVVFERTMKPVHEKFPNMTILKVLNNAEVMQSRVYMTELHLFEAAFERVGRDYRKLIEEVRLVAEEIEAGKATDPFEALKSRIKSKEGA